MNDENLSVSSAVGQSRVGESERPEKNNLQETTNKEKVGDIFKSRLKSRVGVKKFFKGCASRLISFGGGVIGGTIAVAALPVTLPLFAVAVGRLFVGPEKPDADSAVAALDRAIISIEDKLLIRPSAMAIMGAVGTFTGASLHEVGSEEYKESRTTADKLYEHFRDNWWQT